MKKIAYVIIGLVVVYLILALVAPAGGKVERSVKIEKGKEAILPFLTNYQTFHEKWSPWYAKDTASEIRYSGNPGEIGHKMEWNSKVEAVGVGTLELVAFSGDTIMESLSFEGMGSTPNYYILKETDGKTEVTMGIIMNAPFLFRPMMLFMDMEKQIAPDFEQGLSNLKAAVESAKEESAWEVKEVEWPETNFLGSKREVVAIADMQPFFAKHYPAIGEACGKGNVQPLGAPSAIYWSFDETTMKGDLAAVFRVAPGVKIKGFENYTFPASKVLHVAFYGGYNQIGSAHMAIDTYMKKNSLTQNAVFEEYVTDPGVEKDSTKWLTNVYYMLK